MQLDEKLFEQLKLHTQAIMQAMPDLSEDEKTNLITKAISDSSDIPEELKADTIKSLLEIIKNK